jgi:hypothetical protein
MRVHSLFSAAEGLEPLVCAWPVGAKERASREGVRNVKREGKSYLTKEFTVSAIVRTRSERAWLELDPY